jgi:hypothetical protein
MSGYWYGWIMALNNLGDKGDELRAMGIVLGRFDQKTQIYNNCTVSDRGFVQLMKKKGRFLWHLRAVNGKEFPGPR